MLRISIKDHDDVRPARGQRLRRLSGCVQSPETPSEASFSTAFRPFFQVTPDFRGLKTSRRSGLPPVLAAARAQSLGRGREDER